MSASNNTLIFRFCLGLLGWAAAAPAAEIDQSVVEIHVMVQNPDPVMPWRRQSPYIRRGFGAVIDKGRVITLESLVRNQVMVELRRARSGVKTAVRVAEADPQIGVAILEWDPAPALADLKPLALSTQTPTNADVTIIQFDDTGSIQSDQAHVNEILVAPLPDTPNSMLTFRALSSLNTGDRGAPVLYRNELAGLVLQSERSSQTCRILPAAVLRRFLEDVKTPPYRGVAVAGFSWTPLIDPVKRAYRGADPTDVGGGIEVVSTLSGTPAAGVLKPGDILLEWDGFDLDSQGYYDDPEFGRLLLPYLISGRGRPGISVSLRVLREGESRDVNLTLSRRQDAEALIPDNYGSTQAEYLMECGLVFRELGGDYLRASGDKWMIQGNPRLVYYFLTRAQSPEHPGDHIVILVGVLPDAVNVGYQHIRDAVVTAVNGESIRNLADMFRIVDRDGGLRRITLLSSGQDIVLDTKERQAANQRLAKLFRIPALRHQKQR
jgi:S1-C subfamily serine protease